MCSDLKIHFAWAVYIGQPIIYTNFGKGKKGYRKGGEINQKVILYVVVYLRCRIRSKGIGASKPVGQTVFGSLCVPLLLH